MATYPIKILKDESNEPFVPLTSMDCIKDTDGKTLEQRLAEKLGPANLLGGNNITIRTEGYDCYIDVDLPAQINVINNLTANQAGEGVLDAYQGRVLSEKIPILVNSLDSSDATKALSANQGRVLKNIKPGLVNENGGHGEIFNTYDGEYKNIAGNYAHAHGIFTKATGDASTAEGDGCTASGYAAHACGEYSEANGRNSFAIGKNTKANGDGSMVIGTNVNTYIPNSLISGQYGELTVINNPNTYFAVCNGTNDSNFNIGLEFKGTSGNGELYVEGKKLWALEDIPGYSTTGNKTLKCINGNFEWQ